MQASVEHSAAAFEISLYFVNQDLEKTLNAHLESDLGFHLFTR